MNINQIVASRVYSWVYQPTAEQWSKNNLNKGRGQNVNPLFGRVSVRSVKAGQAGSMDMYVRKATSLDPNYAPSDRTPTMEATSNPCVFRNLSSGEFQVLIMNSRTNKLEYFVDGQPATQEQLATINLWRKARQPRDPSKVKIEFPYLSSLANVDGEFQDVEGED